MPSFCKYVTHTADAEELIYDLKNYEDALEPDSFDALKASLQFNIQQLM
jgi:hypothetical protein